MPHPHVLTKACREEFSGFLGRPQDKPRCVGKKHIFLYKTSWKSTTYLWDQTCGHCCGPPLKGACIAMLANTSWTSWQVLMKFSENNHWINIITWLDFVSRSFFFKPSHGNWGWTQVEDRWRLWMKDMTRSLQMLQGTSLHWSACLLWNMEEARPANMWPRYLYFVWENLN